MSLGSEKQKGKGVELTVDELHDDLTGFVLKTGLAKAARRDDSRQGCSWVTVDKETRSDQVSICDDAKHDRTWRCWWGQPVEFLRFVCR